MARIAGINIPLNKRAEIGLTYIYGIGRSTSNKVLAEAGVEPDRKVKDLTEDEVRKIRERVDELLVEGDLGFVGTEADDLAADGRLFLRADRSP